MAGLGRERGGEVASAMETSKLWQRSEERGDTDNLFDGSEEDEEMIPADPMLAETHYSQYEDFESDEEDSDGDVSGWVQYSGNLL